MNKRLKHYIETLETEVKCVSNEDKLLITEIIALLNKVHSKRRLKICIRHLSAEKDFQTASDFKFLERVIAKLKDILKRAK